MRINRQDFSWGEDAVLDDWSASAVLQHLRGGEPNALSAPLHRERALHPALWALANTLLATVLAALVLAQWAGVIEAWGETAWSHAAHD